MLIELNANFSNTVSGTDFKSDVVPRTVRTLHPIKFPLERFPSHVTHTVHLLDVCTLWTPSGYLRRRRLCFHFGLFVCLSVCPSDNWRSCERILTKFLGGVGHGPGTNDCNFGDNPDHRPDPGVRSPKSGFTGLSNYQRIFMKFYGELGWPRDQLITFLWRSASLSGSGSPFRITIRIREELPQF